MFRGMFHKKYQLLPVMIFVLMASIVLEAQNFTKRAFNEDEVCTSSLLSQSLR
jgi:hypothetical protein